MPASIVITCPECKKDMKAPAELEGKKVRCKSCSHAFVARAAVEAGVRTAPGKAGKDKPAAKGKKSEPPKEKNEPAKGAPPQPAKPAAAGDDDEDGPKSYGLTETSLAPRCPECANELDPPDAVICLHCGYNTLTRQRASFRKVHETTALEHFLWLLPGILCVIVDLVVIGFDIWYVLKIHEYVDLDSFFGKLLSHGACKLWLVIISLFIMFFTTKFAIRRLILNPRPPEVEKQ